MELWPARGVLQMFVAILALEEATADGQSDFAISVGLYRTVAGTCLLACAGFYLLGGILCIGMLKDVRYKRQMERLRAEKDLAAIEKQREELQRLLKQ